MSEFMSVNESGVDRTLRAFAGLIMLSLVAVGPQSLWGLVGIVPLATGLLGHCPLYGIMGWRTCPMTPAEKV
ncbi:MAG: hypothetical protein ACI87W_002122 [Halieaceae bacterium]|jgi:hypothetical protein